LLLNSECCPSINIWIYKLLIFNCLIGK